MSTKNTIEIILDVYRTVSGVRYAEDSSKSTSYRVGFSVLAILAILVPLVLLDREEIVKIVVGFIPVILINIGSSLIDLEKITTNIKRMITLSDGYRDISIVGLMARDKYKNMIKDLQYLFFGGAVALGLQKIFDSGANYEGVVIMLSLGAAIAVNYLVFIYRVKADYFGNNIREAREIISYIQENSSSIGGGSGDGGKRILEEKSLSDIKTSESPEGLQHV